MKNSRGGARIRPGISWLPISKSLLNQFNWKSFRELACLNIEKRESDRMKTRVKIPKKKQPKLSGNYLQCEWKKQQSEERSNRIRPEKTECIKECPNLTTLGLVARTKTQTRNSMNFFNFSISFFTFFPLRPSFDVVQHETTEECCALPCPFACQFNCIIKAGSLSIDILSNLDEWTANKVKKSAREIPIKEGTHKKTGSELNFKWIRPLCQSHLSCCCFSIPSVNVTRKQRKKSHTTNIELCVRNIRVRDKNGEHADVDVRRRTV